MNLRLAPLAASVACCLALSACTMPKIWPFYKKPKPVPEAVHELDLVNTDGTPASYPQYWKRNTLVIDLSGVSGSGGIAARLPEQTLWPVRVAVRVRPGSVQQIEVQAEERDVLPVSPDGTELIDLSLAPSLYTPKTAAIYISWGNIPQFAGVTPDTAPQFVSPTEVPKTAPAPPAPAPVNEPTPSASEIIAPAGAAPAQPSPPPGN